MKITLGLQQLSYEKRLRDPGILSLEKKRLREGVLSKLKGELKRTETSCSGSRRGNGHKRFTVSIKKHFFTMQLNEHWHSAMVLAGIKLVFFAEAPVMLCFRLLMKIVVITQRCF